MLKNRYFYDGKQKISYQQFLLFLGSKYESFFFLTRYFGETHCLVYKEFELVCLFVINCLYFQIHPAGYTL